MKQTNNKQTNNETTMKLTNNETTAPTRNEATNTTPKDSPSGFSLKGLLPCFKTHSHFHNELPIQFSAHKGLNAPPSSDQPS